MKRPAALLREAFLPGDPVSLGEAAAALGGDEARASRALTYLASQGTSSRSGSGCGSAPDCQ